jgi:crotonobetainyl-CoA:carnitine CoA-transferase CaiB-like acyl-CoA transferase
MTTQRDSHPLPLDGVTVLDLTRALAGPFATTLLSDLGADVIKVESLKGDMIRSWGPFHEDVSLYHLSVNRNKRSISVDFRSEPGRQLLLDIAGTADVLVENFRPGVLEKLGFTPEVLEHDFPHLVVASVSGFGTDGPLRDEPSFDQIAQGMAGLMSITGHPDGDPTRVGLPIADLLSGMFTALGILGSLVGRNRVDHSTRVETSLLESVLGVMTFQAQRYLTAGEVPSRQGNNHPVISPYGVFATADKPLNLAIATDSQWNRLCELLGAPQLANDPRFADGRLRNTHRAELQKVIEQHLSCDTGDRWLERFRTAGLPAGPIHDMADVFNDAQVQSLAMVTDIRHPQLGTTPVLRGPWRLDGHGVPVQRPAPGLGEHTDEILSEKGFSEAHRRGLFHLGVTKTDRPSARGAGSNSTTKELT